MKQRALATLQMLLFCLDSGATAQCELVLTAPSRNILTYLLTNLTCLRKWQ